MNTVTLEQLLTREQLDRVQKIINDNSDSIKRTAGLKSYFNTISEQLESKGVLPDYLAYAVEHAFLHAFRERLERN